MRHLLAAALLLAPLPAAAQDWHRLAPIRENSYAFVDLDSVETQGDLLVATTLNTRMPVVPETNFRWIWLRAEYDCAGNRARILEFKAYDPDRKLAVELDRPDGDGFRPALPDTDAAKLMDFICARDRGGAVKVSDPWEVLP